MMPVPTTQIWDPLVRIGHWILVIAFAIAYFTEDEALQIHAWAGYVVAAYVVVRVIWALSAPSTSCSRTSSSARSKVWPISAISYASARRDISAIRQPAP